MNPRETNSSANPFQLLPRDVMIHLYDFLEYQDICAMSQVDKNLNFFGKSEPLLAQAAKKDKPRVLTMLRCLIANTLMTFMNYCSRDKDSEMSLIGLQVEQNAKIAELLSDPGRATLDDNYQFCMRYLEGCGFGNIFENIDEIYDDLFIRCHTPTNPDSKPEKMIHSWEYLFKCYSEVSIHFERYYLIVNMLYQGLLKNSDPEYVELVAYLQKLTAEPDYHEKLMLGVFFTQVFQALLMTKSLPLVKHYIQYVPLESMRVTVGNYSNNMKKILTTNILTNIAREKATNKDFAAVKYILSIKPELFSPETMSFSTPDQQTALIHIDPIMVAITAIMQMEPKPGINAVKIIQNIETFVWMLIEAGATLSNPTGDVISDGADSESKTIKIDVMKVLEEWRKSNTKDASQLEGQSAEYVELYNVRMAIVDKLIAYQSSLDSAPMPDKKRARH